MNLKKLLRQVYFVLVRTKYFSKKRKLGEYHISDIDNTLDMIIDGNMGVSRFGDGEIKWILKQNFGSFQDSSDELADRLSEVLRSNLENLMICLPDAFIETKQLTPSAKRFWRIMLVRYTDDISKLLSKEKKYYNANITRNYIDYKDKSNTNKFFRKIKMIWKNQNVLLIEGENTRMGVGNDLFNNTKSVQRILCPTTNAFSKYKEILEEIIRINKKGEYLILISLGPTATVLAYDLAKQGIRAIDIGQVDIEYDWSNMGVTKKVPIKGKYVNEVAAGRIEHNEVKNKMYSEEIIARVGI